MTEKDLKKGGSESDFNSGAPLLANADSLAIERIRANSNNKPVYLVKIKAGNSNEKERVFVSDKILEVAFYLNIIGIELHTNKTKKTQKIDKIDVLKNTNEEPVVDIKFPWHMVNEIQNISYQNRKAK